MTPRQEFWQQAVPKNTRQSIMAGALVCYMLAGTALVDAVLEGVWISLLDFALLVGIGLGLNLRYSRVCAVAALVYFAVDMLVLVSAGGLNWLVFAGAAILAIALGFGVKGAFACSKLWQDWQKQRAAQA